MAPYELRPLKLHRFPHIVATIHERVYLPHHSDEEPPSPSRPDDEWIQKAWVVDENSAHVADVLEVAINVSFVERQLGLSSALCIRDVRRVSVAAFGLIGATAVHKVLQDRSLQTLGFKPVWPWEVALRRSRAQDGISSLVETHSQDTSGAFSVLLWLVLLVAAAAGVAFRCTTLGGSTSAAATAYSFGAE